MGGKNHKPTSTAAASTALSAQCAWAIGQAITHLWQANGELEKAIISATGKADITRYIDGVTGDAVSHLERSIHYLYATVDDVDTIVRSYDDLLAKCDEIGYKGNPLVSQIREWDLRERLEQDLFLPRSREMWDDIVSRIEQCNLVEYFKWERDQFRRVIEPLHDLIRVMTTCKEVAAVDPELFVKSVEVNQIPLRQYFFRVFNMWCSLDLMVEMSTSISTELFYRAEGHGSPTEVPAIPNRDDVLREAPARVPVVW